MKEVKPVHKRLFAALLAAVILLLGGCDISSLVDWGGLLPQQVDGTKYLAEFQNNWQYRCLDSDNQKRYGVLYTVLTDSFEEDGTVSLSGQTLPGIQVPLSPPVTSDGDVAVMYRAFFRDNPHFFYVNNTYEIAGYGLGTTASYNTLILSYTMDAATRIAARQALTQAIQDYLANCPFTEDEYEVELYLHDRLATHCTYTKAPVTPGTDENPNAYNAYGALVEGKAVCEGYSRGMQLLLKERGIASTLITGTAKDDGESHMWNLVCINGQNYYLDVTWDDGEDILSHTYFNLTTPLLERTHTLAGEQLGVVVCTADADNFFTRERAVIDSYDRDITAQRIAQALSEGQTTIELRFEPDKYDNGLLFLKNHDLTRTMVASYQKRGQKPLWEYTLYSQPQQYVLMLIKD